MRIVSEAGVCACAEFTAMIAVIAAIPSADLIRWFMEMFCLMRMNGFDQAKSRPASVNRTTIRCRHAVSTSLLHSPLITDEKFHAFTIHCPIAISITTSCGETACDRKMCAASRIRKMRRA
jgi:hypothetical protein